MLKAIPTIDVEMAVGFLEKFLMTHRYSPILVVLMGSKGWINTLQLS